MAGRTEGRGREGREDEKKEKEFTKKNKSTMLDDLELTKLFAAYNMHKHCIDAVKTKCTVINFSHLSIYEDNSNCEFNTSRNTHFFYTDAHIN